LTFLQLATQDSFSSDSTLSEDDTKLDVDYDNILHWFSSIVKGECTVVTRRVNVTQVLGSVTVSSFVSSSDNVLSLLKLSCVANCKNVKK
jgi:hypothetical protein